MTDLILPRRTLDLIHPATVPFPDRNPGLQLDKLSPAGNQEQNATSLDDVTQCSGDQVLLDSLFARRATMLDTLGARRFRGKTVGAMTLHLSRSGVFENAGIALHPVYGFPWIPGSGLKGMTRAWAETVRMPAPEGNPKDAEWTVGAAFGSELDSARDTGPSSFGTVGRIVFHDAWPVTWPKLERDILNNHHSGYYRNRTPPGDWEDPVPVNFLVIGAGTEFEFALSDRADSGDGLLHRVAEWMQSALLHAGAGAKTSAGYGRIEPVAKVRTEPPVGIVRSEHKLELASPAFLAGARRQGDDCNLRSASLRGLLRWWWRTLHAGHLESDKLFQLETLVWGSSETGSAVSVAVEPARTNLPVEFDKDAVLASFDPAKARRSDRKATQGLYYASYGMDEWAGGRRNQRWYRRAGDTWTLSLTSRASNWDEHHRIPASDIMNQAHAALWLVSRFGGIGSKSRKGFGSFVDIPLEPIRSLEDCVEAGVRIREACGISSYGPTGTASLKNLIGPIEVKTAWSDSWLALDRIGMVQQELTRSCDLVDSRKWLGLPRAAGGRTLRTADGKKRLASPMHWSLSRGSGDALTVRVVAFPDSQAHDQGQFRAFLEACVRKAEDRLRNLAETAPRTGARPRAESGISIDPELPPKGSRVTARLLKEMTRRGHWKAAQVGGPMEGEIFNHADVPDSLEPGNDVELVVSVPKRQGGRFLWPVPGAGRRPGRPPQIRCQRPGGRGRMR